MRWRALMRSSSRPTVNAAIRERAQPKSHAVKPKDIDYVVSGRLDYGDSRSVAVTLRLIARTDGMVVWTHTFKPIPLDADPDSAQDVLVRRAATALAQPTGVIQANERRRRAEGQKLDPRYGCLLDYNGYRQSFDPKAHERVKACLEWAIANDPTFAAGFTALARVYVRQFYTQFGLKDGESKPLDRALRLVQHAIALNPEIGGSLRHADEHIVRPPRFRERARRRAARRSCSIPTISP